jgi:creatinine amidohydrolase
VLEDVLNELVRTGFTRIMVYNWHFENAGFVYEPAFLVSERHPQVKIVVVEQGLPQFSEEDLAELFPEGFPGFELEHASLIETSLFQYLRPGAVREDLIRDDAPLRHPPYDVVPIDRTMSTTSGVLASPSGSSSAKGKLIADRISEYILGILHAEFPVAADSGEQDAQVTGAAR